MRKYRPIFLLMLTVFCLEAVAFSQEVQIPKLLKRVTDLTNTLSAAELASLEQDLARFEDSTSNQLVVVMLPTIGGGAIEDFSLRTVEANQPGQKGKDNGVLLLIAKDDRKIRIEVGYGLEGVLPDGLAGTIIRQEITPHFKTGDYYGGIKAGTDAIMLATRNEYKGDKKESDNSVSLFAIIFFFLVFALIMRSARRRSGLSAALPFLIASGLPRSRGGWGGGGGGGGFGGFSGGGGSFGGGGASGGW